MPPILLNNRYRILEHLSGGGFGKTFLAEDIHLPSQRRCVVKQLHNWDDQPELEADFKAKFQREAALLETLGPGCPQIPQLYAYFAEGPHLYIVQEWIEGITLEQWVKERGAQPLEWAALLLVQLLPVLEYVHQHGVIHRDIKPSNIIVRPEGQPVLIDFGIAKELISAQPQRTTAFALGTAGFMAPEQAMGQPFYSSDLYSLGLTTIYLMTGQPPQALGRDASGGIPWVNAMGAGALDSSFVAWLNRAIALSPGDRYPSATAMLEAASSLNEIGDANWALPLAHAHTAKGSANGSTHDSKQHSDLAATTRSQDSDLAMTAAPPSAFYPPSPSLGSDSQPFPLSLAQVGDRFTDNGSSHASTHASTSFQRNRRILINKVRNYWVKGVLETSLHDRALMALGFEQRLDAIHHPWSLAWETQAQSRQGFDSSIRAIDLFEQLGEGGTLLILGQPGSGKTTTLLELCRALLTRAEANSAAPIPVVFNLSTWGGLGRQRWFDPEAKIKGDSEGSLLRNQPPPIDHWIIEELNAQYQVSKDLAQTWLRQQQLLLLLDGLDEVVAHRRVSCVEAINQFVKTHGNTELVVCSRLNDYEVLSQSGPETSGPSGRLQLQAAIVIQPLTPEKVNDYLASVGEDLAAVQQASANRCSTWRISSVTADAEYYYAGLSGHEAGRVAGVDCGRAAIAPFRALHSTDAGAAGHGTSYVAV